MSADPVFVRLDGERTSIVWESRGDALECRYLGPRLPEGEDLAALAHAGSYGGHENMPDAPPTGGLMPDPMTGWRGPVAVGLADDSARPVTPHWTGLALGEDRAARRIAATWQDPALGVTLTITWTMGAGDIVSARTRITANGTRDLVLTRCAAQLLPLPRGFDHVTHFAGRWTDDMRSQRLAITRAALGWASRGGKSGFAGGDWLVLDDAASGAALGFHFAWSGDHEIAIARNEDGAASLLAEAPTGSPRFSHFTTPEALFGWAADADTLTHAFHAHARARLAEAAPGTPDPPRARKIHFNTWEACAFDLDEARLMRLAEEAAALGAERFVLDDGWFAGRRSDRAGLGDWVPDPERFPRGLGPLIGHVAALGMDFGLWVEPEMVSPDSDLYRRHPDWCLHLPGRARATERHQLALDLARPEVAEFVHDSVARLLAENAVAYLKWDHNRRLFPAGEGPAQAEALHAIWARLRARFPEVMIESCSSGGGRIDMGLVGLAERVWPSDNNDPVERVRIMREWSRFLPLELLGNHVGPSPNPVTGRHTAMDFRAKVALFGHMGIEADPGAMSAEERECLAAHLALHKAWRDVLHEGVYWRLDHPDPGIFAQMVTGQGRALAIAAQTGLAADFQAAPVRLKGLDPAARYRVTLPLPWPERAARYLPDKRRWRDGFVLSGAALMAQGLALPLIHPETAWLVTLEKIA